MKISIHMFRGCTLLLLIVLMTTSAPAQVNVRIGYNLAFPSAATNNMIIDAFNARFDDRIEVPMGGLGSMQGIGVGVRYGFEGRRHIELGWDNLAKSYAAYGENPNGSLFREEVFYRMNQFVVSYESQFGIWGFGPSVVYNRIRISNEIADSDFKKTIVSGDQLAVRMSGSLYFRGDRQVSFAIKPFIQWPLHKIEIGGLHDELLDGTPSMNPEEGYPLWGLSFVFYNGP